MPEPTYLNLHAEDGRPLRHKYLRQEGMPKGLLVVLPGDHYGVDGPLLYYASKSLQNLGWDTAAITYGYQSAGVAFSVSAIAEMLAECQRAIERLLLERGYERLVLMGKSLGAALITLLQQQMALPTWTRAVYLTPPLGSMFNPTFLQAETPALVALGTADRYFDADKLAELGRSRPFTLLQVEKADHSMNVEGDLAASLQAVHQVVDAVVDFVGAGEDSLP